MDINELVTSETHEAGIDVELYSPETFKPLGVTLKGMGPDSKAWFAVTSRVRKALYAKAKEGAKITEEDERQEEIERAIGVCLSWEGLEDKGEPLPCTPENKRRFFTGCYWAVAQFLDKLRDYENFTKG